MRIIKAAAVQLSPIQLNVCSYPGQRHTFSLHNGAHYNAAIVTTLAHGRTYEFNGKITLVGAPEKELPVSAFALLFGNKTLSGSIIGGIAETKTCSTSAASTTSPPMSR